MIRAAGQQTLTLFNVDCDLMRDWRIELGRQMFEKLGLELPKGNRKVESLDLPLIPVQEDFHLFPFRHLSATIVGAYSYKATDFSKDNVLKRSTKLLQNKKAYTNHNLAVGNEIGYVGDTTYSAPYKNSKGDLIPGGIDAPFVIDSKLFPELVRKMSAPVSPIDSASVTVIYEWEASHEFENEGDFFWHVGEMIDDDMVRRIATKIIDYEESSLVWSGADPFAKMLDDNGQVIAIDKAYAFSKAKMEKYADFIGKKIYIFDCADSEKILHLSKSKPEFSQPPKLKPTMNKELAELLAKKFGTTADKIISGEFKLADASSFDVVKSEDLTVLNASKTELEKVKGEKTALETENGALKTDKTKLEGEKAALEPMAKAGKAIVEKARASALKTYNVFAKGKPDAAITKELTEENDFDKLDAKVKMFGGVLATEYGCTCTKCNSSEHILFRSSVGQEDPNAPETPKRTHLGERALG